ASEEQMRIARPSAVVGAVVLSLALTGLGQAAARFSSSEVIVYPSGGAGCAVGLGCPSASTDTGNLAVSFDEGGLKKLAGVDFRLDAKVTATWSCGDFGQIAAQYAATATTGPLVPNDKGHASGEA